MSAPAAGPRWSLRTRLMVLAGVASAVAWLMGGIAMLLAARGESERLYDEHLRDVAHVILSFANHEIAELRAEGPGNIVHQETATTLDRRYRYQVWSPSGELLLISHDTARTPFAPLTATGYVDADIDGRRYCVYAAWSDDRTLLIQVAEDESLRATYFVSLNAWLLVFFVATSVLLLLLNRWMFGRATRALDQSARQLLQRSADDLRPIVADDPPRELAPLLESINGLFARFERTLDSERHFTAAAAHELRTPLAAVRVQAQVAERARSNAELHQALVDLGTCIDRAARMIDQLLTLARVESPSGAHGLAPVRVDEIATAVVHDLAPLTRSRGLRLRLDLAPCAIRGMEFGVAAMARNLIDNALRYSPPGGAVTVETGVADGRCFLAVDDSGPGIPAEERERVFARFYRLASSNAEGCGVGLSIVQCVARVHEADIVLADSPLGGLRAAVYFPCARPLEPKPERSDAEATT